MNKTIIVFLLLLLSIGTEAQTLHGRAVKITDGDTFTLLVDGNEQVKVRLDGIDAPEKGQAFGNKAKEYLSVLIGGVSVTVTVRGTDRYKRILGAVSTAQIADVNLEMIRAGYAWHYKEYNKDKDYATAEEQARKARKGLWQDTNPVYPQDFRKARQQKSSSVRTGSR